MPIDLLMPALSPTMTEGTLARWLKNENDAVRSGDILAEIETDKATMEIEAIDDGILAQILVPAGTGGVSVNTVIARLLEEDEDPSSLQDSDPVKSEQPKTPEPQSSPTSKVEPPTEPAPPVATPEPSAPGTSERVFASPLARRIAADKGLNLQQITGSGPHGRIILRDVENISAQTMPATGTQIPSQSTSTTDLDTPANATITPLSAVRKVIAQRLTESKQTIPHFYLSADCRLDSLLELRAQMNEGAEKHERISINDLVIKACAVALMRQPLANACFDGEAIQHFDHADIAVAVSIPDGLITPVIRRADQRSVSQISASMKNLASRAREGKLSPEEYQGGSFTISNLGMFGVDQFQAVINPPHACILAVGRGRKTPVALEDGSLVVATVMNITLSVDHRAVDGALAAVLLEEITRLIEQPIKMLI